MEFQNRVDQILAEIQNVLQRVDTVAAAAVVARLLRARRVYVAGGGRSGLMARAFAQRLMHLGLTTYVVGETTTPAIRPEDVLVVCSGSGETQVTILVSEVAKGIGAHVVAVTANRDSPIARLADTLEVTARMFKTDAARLEFEYEIRREGDGTLLANGSTVQVFTNLQGELLLTWPPFMLERLKAWEPLWIQPSNPSR